MRGDVAIKLYGDDLDKMGAAAQRIVQVLQGIPGAADVKAEQTSGSPTLDVRFDRAAIARYGLTLEEVADTVAAAMGGREAGLLFEGDRRFEVTVRVPDGRRQSLDALAALPVLLPAEAGGRRGIGPAFGGGAVPVQRRAEPDQPRKRQAPRRHPNQRQGPRRRFFRRRGAGQGGPGGVAGRLLSGVGRAVPEPTGGVATIVDRGALVLPRHFRAALHGFGRTRARRGRVPRGPARIGGRRLHAGADRHPLLGIGGGRVHLPCGRRGVERVGGDDRDPRAA